ncbi:MAG: hypothetical protein A3I63_05105 [Betaproteobacteria bacterium RIFCSPLOWO2_02_FULL_66_14]|nr:MAG: hypothetical protein A3I63_05105 [Betaproteobacteria bacterium RIFCSPLOWO2_02_FULL_66_14]
MAWILGILGLLVGAGIGEFWGAVAGCIAGAWLGHRLRRPTEPALGSSTEPRRARIGTDPDSADLRDPEGLRRHVAWLTHRVSQLEDQLSRILVSPSAAPASAPAEAVAAQDATAPVKESAEQPAPAEALEPEPQSVDAITAPSEPAPSVASSEEQRTVELPKPSPIWNWFFGGNALVRIGVLVLFFGVAFLVRYAAEHVDLPIEFRLTGVAIGAIAMLIVGWRLRDRPGGYGLVLQGGGVGVLYLVVFGAFRLWKLMPPEAAFVLLVVIALASALLAVAQDSRSLASFGVTGGFLAPLLASTGEGNHVALFSYYVVLDVGVLVIAWYKAWRALNLLGFVFTFGIGTIWGGAYYRPEHYATTQPFLAVFFLLYVAIAVLYALRRATKLRDTVDSVLVFGTPLVAAALQLALVREIEYGAAWSAVALGAFYCTAAHQLWRLHRETLQLLVECFVALGIAFATLAIPYAFDGRWTAASWALEGAAALWVGTRQRRMLAQYFGLLLQPAAGVAFLLGGGTAAATPVLNSGFVGGMTIALSALFCAWYLSIRQRPRSEFIEIVAAGLLAWGTLWWLGTGWEEARRFAPTSTMHALQLGHATVTALAFVALRRGLDWVPAAFGALSLLPVIAVWGSYWLDRHAHPFAAYGYLAWPAAFATLYGVLARIENDLPKTLAGASHCASLWLLALLGGWECAWQVDLAVGEGRIWSDIARPLVPVLLAAWIATRNEDSRWPVGPHRALYLSYALLPLVAALWLWIVYINVRSSGNPRPLGYLPLLNPLDVSVALIVVVSLLWWRALREIDLNPALQSAIAGAPVLLGATGFLWANGILLRTLHHWADVPFRWEAMWRSTLVQTAFSVFWAALALVVMVAANRRGTRVLWMCGAALLGVVVVKLFLLDLSKIGGIERIVSFLGVGILLLVVGYLAPVPPRTAKEE